MVSRFRSHRTHRPGVLGAHVRLRKQGIQQKDILDGLRGKFVYSLIGNPFEENQEKQNC